MSVVVASPVAVSTNDESARLFKRATVTCAIVNTDSTSVNCRSGPGTGYSIVNHLTAGSVHSFTCYKKGECYEGNCTWDKTGNCYVNGYYTDGYCTAAALGLC
ncbi:hypothetical protein BDZ94DRAFT_1247408 [Collybia nuda]|uniref:Uncharacterized protein n=1 Tax=Collybia nuda TaxID=64659 RepID=A0A9P6CQ16_9AGAR|nr:hypothetical protein BDZ94DRAFT_1247408 [Collybia nuda]